MKLKILKSKLEKGLEKAARLVTKKASLPILSFSLFEAEKNFLKITSTNLEGAITVWVLAKVEKEGKVCLDPKFLYQVLGSLKEETLEFFSQNSLLLIETQNFHAKVKGANPEEFPIVPKLEASEKILIDPKSLTENLSDIVSIPSPTLGKPEISGIFFSFEKEKLRIAATDSFRLAEKKMKLLSLPSKDYSLILPQFAAKEIIHLFGKEEKPIEFYISPNQVFVQSIMEEIEHPKILFVSRLIEGEYPDYQEIIPKKFKTKVIVNRDTFEKHIKAASYFSSRINEIKLKISPSKKIVEIFSQNPDYGEQKSEFPAQIEGEEIEVSFNFKFLLDGLKVIGEKEIEFLLSSEEGPAKMKPKEKEDIFYLLMPIKGI